MSATEWASTLQQSDEFRGRLVGLLAPLPEPNLFEWAWALTTIGGQPVLIGAVARSHSLRHHPALHANHIAATNNVPHMLTQAGERQAAVRLFLVLGHSSAVMMVAVAVPAIGLPVSVLFLFAIATADLMVPGEACRTDICCDSWSQMHERRQGFALGTNHNKRI